MLVTFFLQISYMPFIYLVHNLTHEKSFRCWVSKARDPKAGWREDFDYNMTKYGREAGEKVEKVMHEMKRGKLKSSSGEKVTSRKQAIAIGLSEARRAGAKVPRSD